MQRTHKLIATIALAAMLALAGGAAIATGTIPGSDGVIHGCYKAANGQLRVIDPASAGCKDQETAIQWSQTGPQGIQGPQGEQGPKGDTGEQGLKGDPGQPGADGTNGANGTDGRTILSGHAEPDASLGKDGDFYIYADKSLLYGPKSNGAWGDPTSLVGQQGTPGVKGDKGDKGDTGQQGVQGPAGANGVSGYQQFTFNFTVAGTNNEVYARESCPSNMVVLGGGAWRFTNPNGVDVVPQITQSAPISATTWEVKIDNASSPRNWDYALVITCARAN